MNPLDFFISLSWGQLSTYLFYQGWISFLGLIYCVIKFALNQKQAGALFKIAFSLATRVFYHAAFLITGFYLLYYYLHAGQTSAETLVYLISATVRMAFTLPGASQAIDKVLGEVDDI